MRKLILFLIFGASLASAQTTNTPIPSPQYGQKYPIGGDVLGEFSALKGLDNSGLSVTGGITPGEWMIMQSAPAPVPITGTCSITLPASPTFDTVTAKQLILTGGTPLPDGPLQAVGKSGVLTFVQAPTSGGTTPPVAGKTYSLAVPQLAGWAQNWYKVSGAVATAGQVVFATPVFTPDAKTGMPPATLLYVTNTTWVDSTGQVWVRIGNGTSAQLAAMNWNVVIQ